MLPCPSYDLYALKNEVVHLNWLHPHRAIVQSCDAQFIESFSKESVTTDRGEKVEGFAKCGIVQLVLDVVNW